jgi:hypothetical protein
MGIRRCKRKQNASERQYSECNRKTPEMLPHKRPAKGMKGIAHT